MLLEGVPFVWEGNWTGVAGAAAGVAVLVVEDGTLPAPPAGVAVVAVAAVGTVLLFALAAVVDVLVVAVVVPVVTVVVPPADCKPLPNSALSTTLLTA